MIREDEVLVWKPKYSLIPEDANKGHLEAKINAGLKTNPSPSERDI